ncbi:lasso peptide biosynthesis PqqD family chaperone [Bacillus sp. MRMR6]|uniref:lasso peptide biosynthesis PqqD family chaperone n=1 Tax=Bacillus sp. MRMR6 TaxID=1928617 RepID=UPI0009514E33|nr:lasso peptide biosynthesis PqqD family chaperone [Bacillus sp. MRMR6]OLS38424.1 metallophosphoesterase [Bacillus sp. MRMR6]
MTIKTNISLTDLVVQGKGNIVSDMGGEKVMLSVKNGKYYNLGEIGGDIWGLLESPIKISDVVKALIAVYQVEEMDCQQQVLMFVEHLLEEGLIEKR